MTDQPTVGESDYREIARNALQRVVFLREENLALERKNSELSKALAVLRIDLGLDNGCDPLMSEAAGTQVGHGSRPMTKGQLEYAKRRALNLFDRWNDVAGVVEKHTGYYYEMQGVIEDAVECGAQAACGVEQPLESEQP